MLCLPLRLLIVDRTLAPAELLGAGLALLLWTYPGGRARGSRAGAGMLAAAIVLRELSPFALRPRRRSAMSWIPFAATCDAERLNAALVLLRKAFEYGALVWLLRAAGYRYRDRGRLGALPRSCCWKWRSATCRIGSRKSRTR